MQKKYLFAFSLFILLLPSENFGQNKVSDTSLPKPFVWPYTRPDHDNIGPMDVLVMGTYHFTREIIGSTIRVNVVYNIEKITFHSRYGDLRFKYKGKIYKAKEVAGTDGQDIKIGWDDVGITDISISIKAFGVKNARRFDMNSNYSAVVDIGEVERDKDLNNLSLELAGSYATNIYFDNSIGLQSRLDKMIQLIEDSGEYKNYIADGNNNFNNSNLESAKEAYQKALKLFPNESYPQSQIAKIDAQIKTETTKKLATETTAVNTKSESKTSYSSNSQNSESKNPLETSQSSTTQTNSQIPSLESQYAKLGIPANTPSYTKSELTNQIITQSASLAGELLNDWANNIERKRAAEENEKARNIKSKEDYFDNTYLNPLINKANNGDEIARMTLYFASKYITGSSYHRREWLAIAAKNNNFDAMLEVSNKAIEDEKNDLAIEIIEKAANLGSVDAMVKLADWYDKKTTTCGGDKFVGGENPVKAFEWFEKAALKGSPVAMYRLGMIYKYSLTHDKDKFNYCANSKKVHVKYNIVKDELKAFEWFSKSINPNYKESLFSTSKNNNANSWSWQSVFTYAKASFFHPNSFLELAIFYSSGTVIPKDNEMAKKLKMYYNEYVNINKF